MEVVYLGGVLEELRALPPAERVAMANAFEKLHVLGPELIYPHSSQVKTTDLRELRPRQGRSPWRALYRRIGQRMVVAAIAPEALVNPRDFQRAIHRAQQRLNAYIEGE